MTDSITNAAAADARIVQGCLRESSLGETLRDEHVTALASSATHVIVPAGTVLFAEGDPADALRLLCSGCVALDMSVPVRGSVRIMTLGPRDVLGWSALVGDGHMSATAVVLQDAAILEIPSDILKTLCEDDAELGRAIMQRMAQALARRLRETRLQLLDLFSDTHPNFVSAEKSATS